MKKVLILLSTFNGEKYLQEQLDSLYSQVDVDVQILVRDNGSSDNTQKILEQNKRRHNLWWHQGEYLGISNSYFELLQMGASLHYDYYAFCNQDDVWDNDKLKIAIEHIGNDKPSLYYANYRLFDDKYNFPENHKTNPKRSLKSHFILSNFLGSTAVFNQALIKEMVTFKPNYMLSYDSWVLKVCLAIGGEIIIDENAKLSHRKLRNVDLKTSIRQIIQYINHYHIEKATRELLKGYEDKMIPEYKELCNCICNYKNNSKFKKYLLTKKNINFKDFGLNLIYRFKVIFNKL